LRLMLTVEHLHAVYTKEVYLMSKCSNRVLSQFKTMHIWKIYVSSSVTVNVLKGVKVVGKKKMQERQVKDKIHCTR